MEIGYLIASILGVCLILGLVASYFDKKYEDSKEEFISTEDTDKFFQDLEETNDNN